MSEETAAVDPVKQEEVNALAPRCAFCSTKPFRPQAIPFNTDNGVTLLIIHCEDCKCVINAVILRMPQPRQQEAPRIIRPS